VSPKNDYFGEAGDASLYFTVNPDGSVSCIDFLFGCGISTSASASWNLAVNGQFFPEGNLEALDFPVLPPGSTINSATFSWSVGEGYNLFPGNIDFNEVGYLGLQTVIGPCGVLEVSSNSGSCTFTPASTAETFSFPSFSGGGNAMLVAVIPDEPGDYTGGSDILVSASFTVTENYSTTPEPAYSFLVGLGVVGLIATRIRLRYRVA
jgi:hypothetical protein